MLAQFRHQHFLLFLIAHLQKAALLMFSDRLVDALNKLDIQDADSVRRFKRVIRQNFGTFLRFSHRYYFHELSEQAQIKALFQMCTEHLGNDALYQEVKEEIADMSQYLDSDSFRRQANTVVRLTVVTTFGLIGTVVTGFLGMNLLAEAEEPLAAEDSLFPACACADRVADPLHRRQVEAPVGLPGGAVRRATVFREKTRCAPQGVERPAFARVVRDRDADSSPVPARESEMSSESRPNWRDEGVKIVPGSQLDINTPQTPGMNRAAAITHARTGASKLWAGTVHIDANAKTGAHHHGELESVIYVVSGRARMRWGEHLEFVAEAGPGDFVYVPPFVPHQEINASRTEVLACVLVRSGQDPVVVNLDIEPAEPPEEVPWVDPIHPHP